MYNSYSLFLYKIKRERFILYHDILILGGGASGIMTSIIAKDRGLDVAIIEGNNRIGKKILSTGNGRCNITNNKIEDSRYFSSNKNFYSKVLNEFSYDNFIEFLYSLGLPLIELENGKLYPMSLQSSSVLDVLRLALSERNIPIYLDQKINSVYRKKDKFILKDINNNILKCNKLVLSCGGKSAANTGSDGSGFSLAKSLGHSIIHPTPGLVQLKLKHPRLKALSGIKFNRNCRLYSNKSLLREEFGEILFTNYGISGPPILQISSLASRCLCNKEDVSIVVDMFPNIEKKALQDFLENHIGMFSYRSIHDSLVGILNKKLIPIILKECGIEDIHKPAFELQWNEKNALLNVLKNWEFVVYDTNGFPNSQVTCGGVDTLQVNDNTLESKLVPNLYFTGEILDVHGDCGGFNLQWAWSSGYAVGKNI
ncbi:aminoacetone oxidase family FAD-binding enzyme [Clostridium tetani]|uniref:Aminoacetone oxidase family FAD-binding enzyme n=1 Tax=Clostridium tetani TaxID=1513 RepID=A0A4V1LEH7_CLOTA|nr:aminoacetone oxidase family FAD-binding enzyme [Clostridium tetani]